MIGAGGQVEEALFPRGGTPGLHPAGPFCTLSRGDSEKPEHRKHSCACMASSCVLHSPLETVKRRILLRTVFILHTESLAWPLGSVRIDFVPQALFYTLI